MTIRTTLITTVALALGAGAALAQRPPSGPPMAGPFAERLHEVRMERLQRALDLDEGAASALREEMERHRAAHRDALEARRETLGELRASLREEPVPESEVARRLDQLQEHHATVYRLEQEHHDRLSEILTPSQRARFLVFSRRFDERLREMLRDRGPFRGPGRQDLDRRPDGPGPPAGLGPPDRDVGDPASRAARLRQRLDRLEREIDRVREELGEIESGE